VPKYKVIAHRRVLKFLNGIKDEKLKHAIINTIEELENYPISLRGMDVETIRGLVKTFRIRLGQYRIMFSVDKPEKTIYVTHLDSRKKIYRKIK
jgi:mRNA interferase RelE/StbE